MPGFNAGAIALLMPEAAAAALGGKLVCIAFKRVIISFVRGNDCPVANSLCKATYSSANAAAPGTAFPTASVAFLIDVSIAGSANAAFVVTVS